MALTALYLPKITVDFETRSALDIINVGAYKYSEHPTTDIICLAYKFPDSQTELWHPRIPFEMPFPEELIVAIETESYTFEAHNVGFEKSIWRNILTKRYKIPTPKYWSDTMALCAYFALPLKLERAGEALDLPIQKDKRGSQLISLLSKPRKPTKIEKQEFKEQELEPENYPILWNEDPDLYNEMFDYCIQDVDTEHQIPQLLGELPLPEYETWALDQKINDHGITVDIDAVQSGINIFEYWIKQYEKDLHELTNGEIKTAQQVIAIKEWLSDKLNYYVPNLTAETVNGELEKLTSENKKNTDAYKLMHIRKLSSNTSLRKFAKMFDCVCDDGTIKGTLQYYGASTGRWAGRLVQPQNFPRGDLDFCREVLGENKFDENKTMEILIDFLKKGKTNPKEAIDSFDLVFDDPIKPLLLTLRGTLQAPQGYIFSVADFSSIEAVVLAWIAEETWKIEAFDQINQGIKYKGADDIYCATASMIFDKPIAKKENPKERQIGKICELAFGYQGGLGAWRKWDKKYPDDQVELFKKAWRDQHPKISGKYGFWSNMQSAAINTILNMKRITYKKFAFNHVVNKAGSWLTIELPSGRLLWYNSPGLTTDPLFNSPVVKYKARHGNSWSYETTYGGKLTENIVQAIARDFMVEAMHRLDKTGYTIGFTVHDEVVIYRPQNYGSLEEIEKLISTRPTWAQDCPVAVSGWEGMRYRKD